MNVFSCTAGPNDFIFASTTAGFLIYNSSIDKKNTIPPPVYLTNFQVNQKNVEFGSLLSFPYNRNNCLIDFVGVSMRDGGNMKYEYRLVPGDVKWQSTGGQRSVSFGALKPGHYRFSVKAINADGVASLAPAILEFTINPPYWLTWWFITAVLVLIASGVYLLISIREEQIIAVERVRSRIAADLHDDIGSGLIRIALLAEVIHRQVSEQKGEQRMERDAPAFGVSTTSLKVGTIARELVDAMNDVVWSVDPRNDSLERLIRRIEEYATELCDARGIAIAFTASAKDRSVKLGSQVVRCLLLVSKETVTNIVRHAECRNVSIDIRHEGSPGTITLLVRDDGKGFDAGQLPRVNGLDNMRQRAEKIGATFAISSGPGQGTAIEMEIPL